MTHQLTQEGGVLECTECGFDPKPDCPWFEPCDFCEVAPGKPCLDWCNCRACKERASATEVGEKDG